MKLFNFNKVLCLSPHPDDVEYSMLGTIMKHPDTSFELLQLAQGGDCDPSTSRDRLDEVVDVWERSCCKNIKLSFTDNVFIKELSEDKWINQIESYMDNVDAIFLPNDCDSHFEHRFISGFGPALIRNKAISLIQYYTPSTQDEKILSLLKFKSQNHRYYFRPDVLRAFHSDFQCSKKGKHYVEKYKIINLFE